MASQPRRRDRLRLWLVPGFVLILLQTVLIGCSDDNPTAPKPTSGSWQDIGPPVEFANVGDLVIWNGLLVAGGTFIQEHLESSLLTWNGLAWQRLEPPNSAVNALAVYDGHLIVGCSAYQQTVTPAYSSSASDTLPTLAAWDGVRWTPFDSGPSRKTITALALFEGDLVAAVVLEDNRGGYVSDVERWNGVSWQAVGGTLNGYIYALTAYQGQLVVGGSFGTAGGVSAQSIAAWNGTAWTPLGSGIGGGINSAGTVRALTVDGTTLLAGGEFLTAGGAPAVNVAQWSGAAWDSLPGLEHPGSSGYVRALTMYEEMPVAGGLFPVLVNPVRTWSGSAWVPLSPLNGMAGCFAVYNGALIAGGHFSQGASAVARWVPPAPG